MNLKQTKKVFFILICLLCLVNLGFSAKRKTTVKKNGKVHLYIELMVGAALPINASYVDTHENQDIYWNPNSGFKADTRLTIQFTDIFYFSLPLELIIGFYRYNTTDGRKVNTEAQAGSVPETVNTEWSIAPNFVPMFIAKFAKHPGVPYIGLGIGLGLMWSFESWDFVNVDGDETLLKIAKFYWPTAMVKAEVGWYVPIKNGFYFRAAATFNLANYIMRKVVLTHYIVDKVDYIEEYDEKSTIYNYAFNAPDENKGGDCLLAGFTYQNYPQQKISTNVCLEIGFAYMIK
ncbi:MAG: hypothetical protein MJB14_17895 [Spirochaetes bacterium]|nr:hypothetical protein [Spirochaetota bacterium]